MPKVRFDPLGKVAEAEVGDNLLDTALVCGVHINASCGGLGVCGKCRVTITEGEVEGGVSEKLSQEDRDKGVRLACKASITGDVVVEIPVESAMDKAALKALAGGSAQVAKPMGAEELKEQGRFAPALTKLVLTAPEPTLDDNRNDVKRLLDTLKEMGESHFVLDFEAIRRLAGAWRNGEWTVTVTILRPIHETGRSRILRVEPGDTTDNNLALAIDLGTTTVWAQLLDIATGEILGTEGGFNSQISHGEDVITRIIAAGKDGGLRTLRDAAASSINSVIQSLFKRLDREINDVNLACLAGNTTMTQLFLEMNPKYIRLEPYVPTAAYYPPVNASQFGLSMADHTQLVVFPAVASYVGGDVVSGVLGVGMHKDPRLTLFLDMGTNGEVVVGNQDWLACAAASAGPAFEGGGIKFGMRASAGAIENFSVNPVTGEPGIVTVGRQLPKGICGSGLIACVASFIMAGLIDESGKFNLDHPSPRVREGEDGPEYVLAYAEETQVGRDITLTEIDIENLMRAKGAMYAAYTALLEGVGLSIHDLERVVIAGGFGQSLNIERAIIIGLLPELPPDKFTFVGNGSLLGTRLVCLSNPLREEVGGIVDACTNFELSVHPGYMDYYTSSMFLPHTEAKTQFPEVYSRIQEAKEALKKVKNEHVEG
jgi:uncharacterized 2Fe-2S/4Fe-4S cluster protein (DUF4445 family)